MPTATPRPVMKTSMIKTLNDRIDSGKNKPIVVQANTGDIPQNVSDRDLAHAVSGGFGGIGMR